MLIEPMKKKSSQRRGKGERRTSPYDAQLGMSPRDINKSTEPKGPRHQSFRSAT